MGDRCLWLRGPQRRQGRGCLHEMRLGGYSLRFGMRNELTSESRKERSLI